MNIPRACIICAFSMIIFLGCSSKEPEPAAKTEKPVVQDMDIRTPEGEQQIPVQ